MTCSGLQLNRLVLAVVDEGRVMKLPLFVGILSEDVGLLDCTFQWLE